MGSAKIFLVDKGEFDNDEFRYLCESVKHKNLHHSCRNPWSNGTVERHNATLGFSVQKIMDDLKCDLSLAVAFSSPVSAKKGFA